MSAIMEKEPEYITVNRRAYDRLASAYRARAAADRVKDVAVIAPFVNYLKERFASGARILDVGCGNGVNLAMFHERGFRVAGIDISAEMLAIAKELCPDADLHLGDFLSTEYKSSSFEGIFSKASIHLFPKQDALRVIRKVGDLLVTDGMFYVTTTASPVACEGYSEKRDYNGGAIRYRKQWTREELIDAVTAAGLAVYAESYNHEEDWNKTWFNVWALKKRKTLVSI